MFRKNNNCILILAISAVLGIIVGVVAYNVTIPGITIALGVTLAFTALILLLSTGIALKAKGNESECLCNYSKCLALWIVGTIITGIIALSITMVTEYDKYKISQNNYKKIFTFMKTMLICKYNFFLLNVILN